MQLSSTTLHQFRELLAIPREIIGSLTVSSFLLNIDVGTLKYASPSNPCSVTPTHITPYMFHTHPASCHSQPGSHGWPSGRDLATILHYGGKCHLVVDTSGVYWVTPL